MKLNRPTKSHTVQLIRRSSITQKMAMESVSIKLNQTWPGTVFLNRLKKMTVHCIEEKLTSYSVSPQYGSISVLANNEDLAFMSKGGGN